MSDLDIRIEGRAGRITLTREKALNALSYAMCLRIEDTLRAWEKDAKVDLVIIDAQGARAFCAGGDIAELYDTGTKGDFAYGRKFWADEYRLNAYIADFPKPIVSFMHGFTMGGGVGLGAHASHRVVCQSTVIAMPECSIGFVPDVGGSYILAKARGALGVYLGLTCARMNGADAIYAGFADYYIDQSKWEKCISEMCNSGTVDAILTANSTPDESILQIHQDIIDAIFGAGHIGEITSALNADDSDFAATALKSMSRHAPLSLAVARQMQQLLHQNPTLHSALKYEYRVAYRIMEHGDMLEGIRAAIIDKDRSPKWQFQDGDVPEHVVEMMLSPLGENELKL